MGVTIEERDIPKNKLILEPEDKDKVYIIKQGQVRLYQLTENGKRMIIGALGPGDIFGNFGADGEGQNFAEASTDAFICVADRETFFRLVAEKPEVSARLLMRLFDQLSQAQDYLANVASGNVLTKLKFKLADLAKKYGEENGEKVKIAQRFTHEEIADMIGVSRETVTKLLGSLRRRGIIELDGRNVAFHKERLETA